MSDATKHTTGVMHAGEPIEDTGSDWVGLYVTGPDGEDIVIADARSVDAGEAVCDANAEHIAHCWNCHDELLAACRAALLEINGESPHVELAPLRRQLEAALARAGQAVPS